MGTSAVAGSKPNARMDILIVLVAITTVLGDPVQHVQMESKGGSIRGIRETVYNKQVDSFLGIPYAKPPLGNLRFQRPQPPDPWVGTYDATHKPPSCHQLIDDYFDKFSGVDEWNANTNISEDCLYLNVWTPSDRKYGGKLRPVMVWIYGGSYTSGTSTLDIYDGRTLASTQDVIIVSMQYRVGAFGFMFLDIPEVPGNIALLDQMFALQWVYNNIDVFGGNQHQITLFGESSGAVSTSYHLLSPLSMKLFKQAILSSGSALSHWGFSSRDEAKRRSLHLAKLCGCNVQHGVTYELLQCLRNVDAQKLSIQLFSINGLKYWEPPLQPTIDGYFLRESPTVTLKKGTFKKTTILLGNMKDEGTYILVYSWPDLFNAFINGTISKSRFLLCLDQIAHTNNDVIKEAVKFEYEVELSKRAKYYEILDDIIGDVEFICPTVQFAQAYVRSDQTVFMYQMRHRSERNPWPDWMGVMHGYELEYLFGLPLNRTHKFTEKERNLSVRIMKYWSNFAKTGNPNAETEGKIKHNTWPKYTSSLQEYIELDTKEPVVNYGLRQRKCIFWGTLLPKLKAALGNPKAQPVVPCKSSSSSLSVTLLAIGLLVQWT